MHHRATHHRSLLPTLFIAVAAAACGPSEPAAPSGSSASTGSGGIQPVDEGYTAIVDAMADGSGKTTVQACLTEPMSFSCGRKAGSNAKFTAESDGETIDLAFQLFDTGADGFESGAFVGDLTGDKADKSITVSWNEAPAFKATLPAPFDITAPTAGSSFTLATDMITVTWTPSGEADPFEWSLSAECASGDSFSHYGGTITDTGELMLTASDIGMIPPEGCVLTIELARRRKGTVDETQQREGSIAAGQIRTVLFDVKP